MNPDIFQPAKELATLVECYWSLESAQNETPARNTIVPDGRIKMIFHYGDLYKHHTETQGEIVLPRSFVVGQLTQPFEVEPMGETGIFFVCFQPNGFSPLTTMPIKTMENTVIPLHQLFGQAGQIIEQQIINAATNLDRIDIIETFLFEQLANKDMVQGVVKSAVDTIVTANGQLSVGELETCLRVNRRKLERQFLSKIGLRPKQLLRIIRLQATLKTMINKDFTTLTNIACENEYFDQSHFNKEFKEFTGLTPKKLYGNNLKMSLIFDAID